jgi:hypothetical protein
LVSLLLRGKLWKNYTNESKTNNGVVLEEATFEGYRRCVQPQLLNRRSCDPPRTLSSIARTS